MVLLLIIQLLRLRDDLEERRSDHPWAHSLKTVQMEREWSIKAELRLKACQKLWHLCRKWRLAYRTSLETGQFIAQSHCQSVTDWASHHRQTKGDVCLVSKKQVARQQSPLTPLSPTTTQAKVDKMQKRLRWRRSLLFWRPKWQKWPHRTKFC